MAAPGRLARTPFFSFGGRPYVEQELAAHIHREHRRGRRLADILQDSFVVRCGPTTLARVLRRRRLLEALEADVAEAIRAAAPQPTE
jgi:hypothetical protein